MKRAFALLWLLPTFACGPARGTGDGGSGDASFSTAPHQAFPLLTNHDGGVLPHPQLVTITYPGFALTSQVQSWGDFAVTSGWIHTVGEEYGIGAGTHLAKVVLPDPAPGSLTDLQIQQNLVTYVGQGVLPALPRTDNEVVYMLYLNTSTTMNDDGGLGVLCTDFVGYHGDIGLDAGATLYYAVVADCSGQDAGDVESTAAHELIETATDPVNAWWLDVPLSSDWESFEGSEVGDMCEFLPNWTEGAWTYQRSWSNAAASAGGDPCVPVPAGPGYWNVSPSPGVAQTVAPAQTVQIEVTGWSTAAVASWPVSVGPSFGDFDPIAYFDAGTLNNGESFVLTLTVPGSAGSGQFGTVLIYSDANQDDGWPVTVTTP